MAKKNNRIKEHGDDSDYGQLMHRLHPDAKKSIWAVAFAGFAVILALAAFGKAGPAGQFIYDTLTTLLGWGYFILPATMLFAAGMLVFSERERVVSMTLVGSGVFVLSVLGLIELFSTGHGGWLGLVLGSLKIPFGETAAIILNIIILIISAVVASNTPIRLKWPGKKQPMLVTGTELKQKLKNILDEKEDKEEEHAEKDEEEA